MANALIAATLDAGQLVATPRAISLRNSIKTVVDVLDLSSTSIDITDVGDLTASVDPGHFGQVITNLLTNAAKYGAGEVIISATPELGRVRVSIADNGPGVEPDFVPHLFDRFSRSDRVRQGSQRGSGLGLYIVRDLLAANGGSISYVPSAAGGATFTIELPTAPAGVASVDDADGMSMLRRPWRSP